MAIEAPLQQLVVEYLDGIGVSQRKFAELTGLSDTTYGTYRRMTSAMGIDALEKILTAYPGLKQVVERYLRGNTDENPTPVEKAKDNSKNNSNSKETFYRDLIEGNPEYSLIPRAVLKDYKIVPDKIIDVIIQSNENEKKALVEGLNSKYELIIAGLENQVSRLEGEKGKLESEKSALEKERDELRKQISTKDK